MDQQAPGRRDGGRRRTGASQGRPPGEARRPRRRRSTVEGSDDFGRQRSEAPRMSKDGRDLDPSRHWPQSSLRPRKAADQQRTWKSFSPANSAASGRGRSAAAARRRRSSRPSTLDPLVRSRRRGPARPSWPVRRGRWTSSSRPASFISFAARHDALPALAHARHVLELRDRLGVQLHRRGDVLLLDRELGRGRRVLVHPRGALEQRPRHLRGRRRVVPGQLRR